MKKTLLLSFFMLLMASANAEPGPPKAFTAGNIVVYRYGDGTADVGTDKQVPVFLDEYTPTGVWVQSIALPTATAKDGNDLPVNRALTGKNLIPAQGTNNVNAEGMLIRSANGAYLTFVGHEAAPYTLSSGVANSVVARVSATGEVNTTTALPSLVVAPYCAVSKDGSQFWIGGVRGSSSYKGITYIPFGYNKGLTSGLGVGIGIGGANATLSLGIFNNVLVYSNAGTIRRFNDDLPEAASDAPTPYPGFGTGSDPSSTQFVIFDTNGDGVDDLMYLINDRINATTPVTGKIMKYVWNGTTWVKKEYITSAGKTDNMRFLTAKLETVAGSAVATIYCTTPSGLYKLSNNIAEELSENNLNLIVSAPANTTFRGVAFAPEVTTNPVKLTSFTGKVTTEGVQLKWITSSETNNALFEVLRSTDNYNFTVIGTVKGNNNSDQIINYSFLDNNPLVGTNYYQLRQIDYDGKSETSAVITVNVNGQPAALTARFTTVNELEVFISAREGSKADLFLTDISGKVLVSETIQLSTGQNKKSIAVKNLVPGVYMVTVLSGNEKMTVKVFK